MVLYFSNHAEKAANVNNRQHQFQGGGAITSCFMFSKVQLVSPQHQSTIFVILSRCGPCDQGERLAAVWIVKHKIIEILCAHSDGDARVSKKRKRTRTSFGAVFAAKAVRTFDGKTLGKRPPPFSYSFEKPWETVVRVHILRRQP
jgi:hypothetical protein